MRRCGRTWLGSGRHHYADSNPNFEWSGSSWHDNTRHLPKPLILERGADCVKIARSRVGAWEAEEVDEGGGECERGRERADFALCRGRLVLRARYEAGAEKGEERAALARIPQRHHARVTRFVPRELLRGQDHCEAAVGVHLANLDPLLADGLQLLQEHSFR
eukprot:2564187-Pleurochrysis_carterae.AAC.2